MKKIFLVFIISLNVCWSPISFAQAELVVVPTTFTFTQAVDQANASFRIDNRGSQRSPRFRVKMWASKDRDFSDDEVIDVNITANGTGLDVNGNAVSLTPGPDGFFDGIEPTVFVDGFRRWFVTYRFSYSLPLPDDLTPGGKLKPKSELLGDQYHYQACLIFVGQLDCDPDPRFTASNQSTIVPPVVQNVSLIGDQEDELQLAWREVPFDEFLDDNDVSQSVDFVSFYRIERIDEDRLTSVVELPPSSLSRIIIDGQELFSLSFSEADGLARGKRNAFTVESCHDTSATTTPQLVCFPRTAGFPNNGLRNAGGAIEAEFSASQGSNNSGVLVSWDEPTAAVRRYQIKRCLSSNDQVCNQFEIDGSNTSYLDTSALRGQSYVYTLSACDRLFQSSNLDDPRNGKCFENGAEVYKFGVSNAGFRGLVDIYENDDTPQQATVISNSVQQLHSFDTPIDDDWVRVNLRAPSRLKIATSIFNGEKLDTVLSVFDSSQTLLFENDDSDPISDPAGFSAIETTVLPQGSYFVRATHFKLPIDGFPAPLANNYLLEIEVLDNEINLVPIIQLLLGD